MNSRRRGGDMDHQLPPPEPLQQQQQRPLMSDEPSERRPAPTDHRLLAARVRNECSIPSRRRAICCCLSFWLVVALVVATFIWLAGRAAIAAATESNDGDDTPDPVVSVRTGVAVDAVTRCRNLGPARCTMPHQASAHKSREECPPGHALSVVESNRLPWSSVSQARGVCVRRHFYPRVFDPSLVDADTPVCSDPYEHACGAWDQWFAHMDDAHVLVSRDAQLYHANVLPVLETSLGDRDSALNRFVTQQCRPLVTTVKPASRDTPAQWLAVQEGAQLPLWLSEMDTHTLCLLGVANELVAPWFYQLALGLTAPKAVALVDRIRQTTRTLDECRNATAWLGALGDPLVAQIEWQAPPERSDHAALHALLGAKYGHMWSALSALAPYTWLVVGSGRRVVMRVALPRDRAEWMQRSHCERVAAVAFVEALEDRYTAMVRRMRPEAVLAGITQCADLPVRVSITMAERPQQVRADVWQCVSRNGASNWHSLVAAVAACNAGHRLQPDQPLVDAFVPHLWTVSSDATQRIALYVTPALLQSPWFTDEMELPSVAARLYWTLLRGVAERVVVATDATGCDRETRLDVWTLDTMGRCFRALMDGQFWLELIQLHCGGSCTERWSATVQQAPVFRREHKCGTTARRVAELTD